MSEWLLEWRVAVQRLGSQVSGNVHPIHGSIEPPDAGMCWRSGPRIDDGIPPLAGATIGSGLNGRSHDGIEYVGFVQRCPRKRQSLVSAAERPSAMSPGVRRGQ
jgi:hypothetical protein